MERTSSANIVKANIVKSAVHVDRGPFRGCEVLIQVLIPLTVNLYLLQRCATAQYHI